MIHWLGFGAFTAVAGVQSLVRELKSPKLHGRVQPKQTNKKKHSLDIVESVWAAELPYRQLSLFCKFHKQNLSNT